MRSDTSIPLDTQNNGLTIPQIGLGVFGPENSATADVVAAALEMGYRSIDTAAIYENEAGVGEGIRRSGLPREQIHVTTKLWNDGHGYDRALAAFDRSLRELKLDYVDLYLIHWPVPSQNMYVETWRALEKNLAGGRALSIGVSNFQPDHLENLLAQCSTGPVVNQVELHPEFQNERVRSFNTNHNILTQAWSPLGRGRVFGNPVLEGIAQKHSKTVAQVVIRWHIQLGNAVIPKSITPARLAENLDVFDFALDKQDMEAINGLENGERTGFDPDVFA